MVEDDILHSEARIKKVAPSERQGIFSLRQVCLVLLGATFALFLILILFKVLDLLNTMEWSTSVSQTAPDAAIIINSQAIPSKTPPTVTLEQPRTIQSAVTENKEASIESPIVYNNVGTIKPSPEAINDAKEAIQDLDNALFIKKPPQAITDMSKLILPNLDAVDDKVANKTLHRAPAEKIQGSLKEKPNVLKAKTEKLKPSEKKLMQRKADHYAIQLLALQDETKLKAFILETQLQGKADYYRTMQQGKPLYILVYGNFDNLSAAKAAIKTLPIKLQEQKPWVRTYASIQESLRAQK